MRKYIDELICKICDKHFPNASALSLHVVKGHKINKIIYYTQHLGNPIGICACGKQTKFRGIVVGFDKFCSIKCSANAEEVRQKYAETCIERYGEVSKSKTDAYKEAEKSRNLKELGVESRFQTEEFKEKSKKTCEVKYGVDRASKNETVKQKGKQTCLERYGVETAVRLPSVIQKREESLESKFGESKSPFADPEIQARSIDTKMQRYSAPYTLSKGSSLAPMVREKAKVTLRNNVVAEHTPLLTLHNCHNVSYDINQYFTFTCNKCGNVINEPYQITSLRLFANQDPCTVCNPRIKYTSGTEKELCEFIKTFNHGVIENTNEIISPKEIDVYVPDMNLAFEFNGLYHHSESFKPNGYHLSKSQLCLEKGIQLIHVFEDDWLYKQDIVKSRISSLFGTSNRIFARKCTIRSITPKESKVFLDANHLQGNCIATHQYGLFYGDELVAVMTFGTSRFKKSEDELLRYCNKLNTTVVGGASRLFKHFIKENQHINEVISYADRCWSVGNLYESIGFTRDSVTPPSYYYIVDGLRESRMKYQKHKLVQQGHDPDKSEHQIMLDQKIYRIYDCGNLKYRWTK